MTNTPEFPDPLEELRTGMQEATARSAGSQRQSENAFLSTPEARAIFNEANLRQADARTEAAVRDLIAFIGDKEAITRYLKPARRKRLVELRDLLDGLLGADAGA
jgi:hypothetical protein